MSEKVLLLPFLLKNLITFNLLPTLLFRSSPASFLVVAEECATFNKISFVPLKSPKLNYYRVVYVCFARPSFLLPPLK